MDIKKLTAEQMDLVLDAFALGRVYGANHGLPKTYEHKTFIEVKEESEQLKSDIQNYINVNTNY